MSTLSASFLPLLLTRTWRARSSIPAMGCFLLVVLTLTSCSLGGGGNTSTGEPLSQLHWCGGKPLMFFRDERARGLSTSGASTPVTDTSQASSTPTALTNWNQIKGQLGFTVYLPASLPAGTCLVSASGTVRDAVMGSNFSISFVLPDSDSISLSEALTQSQNQAFQCSLVSKMTNSTPTSSNTTQPPVQLCTGVHNRTNIVFSARGTTDSLHTFFQNLQPDINWVPSK